MKKKELKRQLKATQRRLDDFMDATAETLVERDHMLSEAKERIRVLTAEVDRQSAIAPYACPWCNAFTTKNPSDLRLHEQTCDGNRNRWRPAVVHGWKDVLAELGLTNSNGAPDADLVGPVIHEIQRLKHLARPTCIVCGASAGDIQLMRKHMEVEHAFIWTAAPHR